MGEPWKKASQGITKNLYWDDRLNRFFFFSELLSGQELREESKSDCQWLTCTDN